MTDRTEIISAINYHALEIQKLTTQLSGDNEPSPAFASPTLEEKSTLELLYDGCGSKGIRPTGDYRVNEQEVERLLGVYKTLCTKCTLCTAASSVEANA